MSIPAAAVAVVKSPSLIDAVGTTVRLGLLSMDQLTTITYHDLSAIARGSKLRNAESIAEYVIDRDKAHANATDEQQTEIKRLQAEAGL